MLLLRREVIDLLYHAKHHIKQQAQNRDRLFLMHLFAQQELSQHQAILYYKSMGAVPEITTHICYAQSGMGNWQPFTLTHCGPRVNFQLSIIHSVVGRNIM